MSSLEDGLYDLGRLDRLASLDSPVHRLDPRVKVLVTLAYLVCVVSFGKYDLVRMAPFVLFPVVLIADAGLPARFLFRKVLAVAPFALFVGVFNPILDREPLLNVAGLTLSGGWVSFGSIVFRVLLTTSAALVLIATTGMNGVCAALQRLGLPDVFTTQLLLLYRYIFVLGEETMRMARARALRSFGGRGMGMGVYVNMLGTLLLRTYGRAERVYRAMLARGFDGTVRTRRGGGVGGRDVLFALAWTATFVVFRVYNVPLALGTIVTRMVS